MFYEDDFDYSQILNNLNDPLNLAIVIVGALILLVALFSIGVQIYLMVKYVKYNRETNSSGLNGEQVARKLLDQNGLSDIKVSKWGSIIFGNSYSHYFKKVRLRRLTKDKVSLTSEAMAAQKTGLAILDKEGDPEMRTRVILTPIVFFGPYAFIPLIILGLILDILVFKTPLICALVCTLIGIGLLIASFVLKFTLLKTEIKAQNKAYEILRENNMATEEEIEDMKGLFKLYNIQYINDLIIEVLQIIFRVLLFIAKAKANSSSSSSSN